MQNIAFEMHLSETAFLLQHDETFTLRWFTPKREIEMCGHATMATAHVLWETGKVEASRIIEFETRSGILPVKKVGTALEMKFPIHRHALADFSPKLISAFKVVPKYVYTFDQRLLIEVDEEEMVLNLEPDFRKLKECHERGVVITSRSNSGKYDFVSRYFAPWDGIDEDPVTGATHSCLGPYWSYKLKKKELNAYQASPRGGYLKLRVEEDRVYVAGNAITIYEGTIQI